LKCLKKIIGDLRVLKLFPMRITKMASVTIEIHSKTNHYNKNSFH